jgi:Zn ribbon nucleic-acid-binding protein
VDSRIPRMREGQVDTKDIERMTQGLKAIRDDASLKVNPPKKHLMCIYFYCPRCANHWSVDMWDPATVPCKCGYQKPRVTAIESVDHLNV